jgi:hypothetical protein
LIENEDNVLLLLRILNNLPKHVGHFPVLDFGAPGIPAPSDLTLIPRYPVHLLEDIPIVINGGYESVSRMVNTKETASYINWYKENGIWRTEILKPPRLNDVVIEDITGRSKKLLEQYLKPELVKFKCKAIRQQLEEFSRAQENVQEMTGNSENPR